MGLRKTPIEDPAGLSAIEALRARLAHVPEAMARWSRVARINPKVGSEIALDNDACGWRQLSHGVTHHLNHAADTLNALTILIPPAGGFALPYIAHYPVARSALEAASLALWILSPDDPKIRIERHIRNAWREVSADAELKAVALKSAAADPSMGLTELLDRGRKETKAWKSKHVAQIRGCADRIGVSDPTVSNHTVGFAEVIRDASAATGVRGVYGEMVWREISGLSHPSMMRSMRSQDFEEIVDHGDGTLSAVFTSDAAKVKLSVEAASLAFNNAVEQFGQRKIRPGDPRLYVPSSPRTSIVRSQL